MDEYKKTNRVSEVFLEIIAKIFGIYIEMPTTIFDETAKKFKIIKSLAAKNPNGFNNTI